jgi:ankyrin repeat protein
VLYALSLHDAVTRMDHEALSRALESKEDVNALQDGQTALALAVKQQNSIAVAKLIEASADVNLGKPTPLSLALLADNAEIAAQLMDHDAELPQTLGVSNGGILYELLLKRRYNSVGLLLDRGISFRKNGSLNPFALALNFAPRALIETFIDNGADINYKDPLLDRPLDTVLRLERHDLLALLIEHHVDVSDSSFLEIAVSHKDLRSLKMLVKAGCTIDAKRQNLLLLAVKYGNLEILQELARAGASINYATKFHETALTQAIYYKRHEIVMWLLANEIDPEVHKKSIFYAIDRGDLEMVKTLINRGLGLEAKSNEGLTPLLYAHKRKEFNMAKYFISLDGDIEAKDSLGETALFKSIRFFEDEIMDLLLE